MTLLYALMLFLHLSSAAFWVGGMATMHFAVRPAAVATLEPPQRLPLLCLALRRFFAWVGMAIVLLLVSGFSMIAIAGGFARVHWSVHLMLLLGLVMVALFWMIRFSLWPKLAAHVAEAQWPAAAARLDVIRKLVLLNLGLGVLVFFVAIVGRAL
ncbi:MAG: CopD family protein [Variovorax sp.]